MRSSLNYWMSRWS